MSEIKLVFEPKQSRSTRGTLYAKQDSRTLYSDVIDIARDKDRTGFIEKLEEVCDIDKERISEWMLAEVDRLSQQQPGPQSVEIELSNVVRPHLFHASEVSGVLVPTTRISGGKPEGQWVLCLQWADGKRECVDLTTRLELPDGEMLWFQPLPDQPTAGLLSGWSTEGRKKWLAGDTPDVAELFRRLTECFNYYLDFPEDEAKGHLATLSLWVILTYAYPAWPAVPYLSIGGPLGSGKSRVFDVLSKLVHRPLVSSNMTAPCLFRSLHSQGGILLLDEAERLRDHSTESGEIRSILLGGYRRDGRAHRLEKVNDSFQPMTFDVYGPKAIAGINELPPALASRCIRMIMFRAPKDSEKPRRRIGERLQRFADLRDDLHAFALANGKLFLRRSQDMSVCQNMLGRNMEVWQPILGLAKLVEDAGAKGLVELLQKHSQNAISNTSENSVPEVDEIVLRIVAKSLNDNGDYTAGLILTTARGEDEMLFRFHSPRGIGDILKRYGIRSKRTGGKRLFRPTLKQLQDIEQNYGLDLDLEREGESDHEFRLAV